MDEEKAATRESCARSSLASLAKLTVVPAMKLVSRGNPLSSWLFCHTILLAFLSDASALTSSPYLVAIIAIHSPLRSLSSAWPSASRFPGYDGRKNREMLSIKQPSSHVGNCRFGKQAPRRAVINWSCLRAVRGSFCLKTFTLGTIRD